MTFSDLTDFVMSGNVSLAMLEVHNVQGETTTTPTGPASCQHRTCAPGPVGAVVETRSCRACGTTKPLPEFTRDRKSAGGRTRECSACSRARWLRWKAANGERARESWRRHYRENRERLLAELAAHKRNHREEQRSRDAAWQARRDGRLIPSSCEVCGATDNIEGHHPDYRRALEVVWLCKSCHRNVHAGNVCLVEPAEASAEGGTSC
jgi:hypothetical protein